MKKNNRTIYFLYALGIIFSLFIILGQIFKYPGGVRDIVTGAFPNGVHLEYPAIYTLLAPFFQFSDHLSILSTKQHIAFVVYLNVGWVLFRFLAGKFQRTSKSVLRETLVFILFNFSVALVYAVVILVPRPMAKLVVSNPDILVMDFHSHTSHSWDGRKSFTPLKNLEWHEKSGFHVSFITDHNLISGAEEAYRTSLQRTSPAIIGLRGVELTLHRSHWLILGVPNKIDNQRFSDDMSGIHTFLNETAASASCLSIAYLGGYWHNHWDKREDFAAWGVNGFEIVNAAPHMLDFPEKLRRQMVEFCLAHNKVMVGASDNHGWGSTSYVWNVMEIPGWRKTTPELLEKLVLSTLKEKGCDAVQVLTRVKAEPKDNPYWLAIDPVLQIWEGAKSMPLTHAVFSLVWIWLPWTWIIFKGNRRNPYERTN